MALDRRRLETRTKWCPDFLQSGLEMARLLLATWPSMAYLLDGITWRLAGERQMAVISVLVILLTDKLIEELL